MPTVNCLKLHKKFSGRERGSNHQVEAWWTGVTGGGGGGNF